MKQEQMKEEWAYLPSEQDVPNLPQKFLALIAKRIQNSPTVSDKQKEVSMPTRPSTLLAITLALSVPMLGAVVQAADPRSEEHTSELQSLRHLVCRLLLEK